MKPNYFRIIEECIEIGVRRGYRRAFKHVENPSEESIFDSIEDCVMAEITERFTFD